MLEIISTLIPFPPQESEVSVFWTHHLRYYSVICAWTLGRAKPVCVNMC